MTEGHDVTERELSRHDLLKLAAAAGGAALLGTRAGAAGAALSRLGAESGRLKVLDWAGYENDGGQPMFASYVKKYPNNKPQFSYMTNEADALAKIQAGLKPDLFRPYIGWVKFFAQGGLVQPWDPKLITNFKYLNKFMVKAGQYQGKQYGIPDDFGFDAILYRTDKVKPKAKSYSLLFDERYKGKIGWFDDIEMIEIAGLLMGFPNTWQQTDAQLQKSKEFLISKKHLVKTIWSSETTLDQAFAAGDLWVTYAWPADWVYMKAKKLPVAYMRPKERPIAWVGYFMLLKGTPRFHLAHAYVDAWSSAKSGTWLEDNYAYGHANMRARPSSEATLKVLLLNNPNGLSARYSNLDRYIPRRAQYEKIWEEVKAA
jgi:spermidine/putrescine transport system substrate-binding protein